MIQGTIQNRDVLRHPLTICRSYGLRFFFLCLQSMVDGKRHTFLELWTRRSFRL